MTSAASTVPAKATKAQLARELGVSRQAIGDLVKRGILSEDRAGLIDIELAKLALVNRVRPSSKTAQAITSPATPPTTPQPDPESAAVTSYHVAKTLNEAAQARMNQIKLKEMEGELIRVDAIEKIWASALAATREHLLQVRARLAPLLADESDPFKIEQLLDEEHSQALQHLAAVHIQPGAAA